MPSVQGGQSQVSSVPVKLRFNSQFSGPLYTPRCILWSIRTIHTYPFLANSFWWKFPEKTFTEAKSLFSDRLCQETFGWLKSFFFGVFWTRVSGSISVMGQYRLWSNSTCLWMHGAHHQGLGGHCELFLSKCCTIFMKKERRRAKEGGPLLSRKGLRVQRKRSVRSDLGKKHNYKRKNTRTSQLRSFGNARSFGARWEGCGAALSGALWCWKGINSKFVEPTKKNGGRRRSAQMIEKVTGPRQAMIERGEVINSEFRFSEARYTI